MLALASESRRKMIPAFAGEHNNGAVVFDGELSSNLLYSATPDTITLTLEDEGHTARIAIFLYNMPSN